LKRILSFGLVSLLLISVLLVGTGCKNITGGGWFIDWDSENKITFGINGQSLDEPSDLDPQLCQAKGHIQLIDHGTGDRIHCTFIITGFGEASKPYLSNFGGPATINGEDGYIVVVEVHDMGEPGIQAGDLIGVLVFEEDNIDPQNPFKKYTGWLGGGNIQVHGATY